MKEKTYSPALKKNIRISRKAWDHMFGGSRAKARNTSDKLNRIQLLKAAKFIIKNSNKYTLRVENLIKYYSLDSEYILNGKKLKVRVVIKADKKGFLEFFSVMKT